MATRKDLAGLYRTLQEPAAGSEAQRLESLRPSGGGTGGAGRDERSLEGLLGATGDRTPLLPEQLDQLERLFSLSPDGIRSFLSASKGGQPVSHEEAKEM